jgi:hypothetical protein
MSKKILVDPPGGWKYGFPVVTTEAELNEKGIVKFCLENGYPQEEVDLFGGYFSVRVIELQDEQIR